MLRAVLERSDPRVTRQLPEDIYALAVELLGEPRSPRSRSTISRPSSIAPATSRGALAANVIPRKEVLQAISALTFAEKAALVDSAIQLHAPKAVTTATSSGGVPV